jgi:hypothetical protein
MTSTGPFAHAPHRRVSSKSMCARSSPSMSVKRGRMPCDHVRMNAATIGDLGLRITCGSSPRLVMRRVSTR